MGVDKHKLPVLVEVCAAAGATPHLVALLEVPHPLSGHVGEGYWSSPELCNVAADGVRGRGVAVLLKQGVQCLGLVIESHWVTVEIRDGSLGNFVVVYTYLPTSQHRAVPVTWGLLDVYVGVCPICVVALWDCSFSFGNFWGYERSPWSVVRWKGTRGVAVTM